MTAALVTSSLGIPFCITLVSPEDTRFVTVTGVVLDAVFDVRVFFVGEIAVAFPTDFPDGVRAFVAPVGVELPTDAEARPLVLGADAPEREICLLTVSLLCLSINGDLLVSVLTVLSRGLVVPPEVGAVLGLDEPIVDGFDVGVILTAEVADTDRGFGVTLDVDVFAVVVDVLANVVLAVVPVVVVLGVALAGFAVADLLTDFASPLNVDFFSIDVPLFTFDKAVVVVVFGLVPALTRGEELALAVAVFVTVVLPLTLKTAALADPSTNCLGRVAVLVASFFAVDCAGDDVVRMTALIALEGEVGDFVAVFVVDTVVALAVVVVFVGRFALVVVVVFVFVGPTMLATAFVNSTASVAIPLTFSFDLSIVAVSSNNASTVFCDSSVSSCFGGILSKIIFSLSLSDGGNSASFFSACTCSIGQVSKSSVSVVVLIGTSSGNLS